MGLSGEIQGTEQAGPQICKPRRFTTRLLPVCRKESKNNPVVLGGDQSRLPLRSQLSLENQLCASQEVKGTYKSPHSWSTLHPSLAAGTW